MIHYIVSVRDRKVEVYMPPAFVAHIGQAQRGFADAVNGTKETDLAKHPEDFDLYHIGQYNDFTAEFEPVAGGPRLVCTGLDCVKG